MVCRAQNTPNPYLQLIHVGARLLALCAMGFMWGCESGTTCLNNNCSLQLACESLGCDAQHRDCTSALGNASEAECGGCLEGYQEDSQGQCTMTACVQAGCSELGRSCDDNAQTPPEGISVCGDCLPHLVEQSGQCVGCLDSTECAQGSFCDSLGSCRNECGTCFSPNICTPYGRCVGDNGCGLGQASAQIQAPQIMVVVDRSDSMATGYPDPSASDSRWEVLRNALVGTQGIIANQQSDMEFAVSMFTSDLSQSAQCLIFDETSLGADTSDVQSLYDSVETPCLGNPPACSVRGTPTPEALKAARNRVASWPSERPRILLLTTDGLPKTCLTLRSNDDPQLEQQEHDQARDLVIQEVAAAKAEGVLTYVLSVGINNAVTHLQSVATAGGGQLYDAANPQQLQAALDQFLTAVYSCTIPLQNVHPDASSAAVYMDGDLLAENQWAMNATNTSIELLGDACTRAKDGQDHSITAEFFECVGEN